MNNGKEERYKAFLETLDKWRSRHGITREQAATIFLENDTEDWRSLMKWVESDDFFGKILGYPWDTQEQKEKK